MNHFEETVSEQGKKVKPAVADDIQTWAEIDRQAIADNVRGLKAIVGRDCDLMAVVKADGYGHGMIEVSRIALKNGATTLGVARVEEGVTLRQAGVTAPILVLGYIPLDCGTMLLDFDLTTTIGDVTQAMALSDVVAAAGKQARAHLKIDTGMGRLGLLAGDSDSGSVHPDSVEAVKIMAGLPGLQIEGVYTHFAAADSADKRDAQRQYALFQSFLEALQSAGCGQWKRHAANSAAIIDMPETHLDMVRAGISIYGLYPSAEVNRQQLSLIPAMTLKTRIIQLKQVPAGFSVSYGATYKTPRATTLAVVPIGYADGYSRKLSSCGRMLVDGKKAPIVGRVCMDLTILDVGHLVDTVSVGDEVVVFGYQPGPWGSAYLPVDDIAEQLKTINYEVVSTITERVPRIYI